MPGGLFDSTVESLTVAASVTVRPLIIAGGVQSCTAERDRLHGIGLAQRIVGNRKRFVERAHVFRVELNADVARRFLR